MLIGRRQRVLAALIEEYVSRAMPVGSRTLVEQYHLGVSSATVRNDLSVLEEAGYILQPHTSAGRIPTDIGYRAFVDDLLEHEVNEEALAEDESRAAQSLRESARELDDLMEQTSAALSRLTQSLSIVLPPQTLTFSIRQVTLVSLSSYRVMVIVVTEEGNVFNRQVELTESATSDEVATAQYTINSLIAQKSPLEIEQAIDDEIRAGIQDPLTRFLLEEVLICIDSGDAGHAHSVGLSALVSQPEFAHAQALMPLLEVLEDDTVLMRILQDTDGPQATTVRIGKENDTAALSGVSVVAGRYGRGASEGLVAVIGPTRMDYAQVIRAVRTARRALGDD